MSREKDTQTSATGNGEARPESISRRALLKGTAVSMPMILTLHSGAALARSSNLISAAPPESVDALGRTLCLDISSVRPADEAWGVYDVNDPPFALVNAVNHREYRREANFGSPPVGMQQVCEGGGRFFYHGTGWQEVNVPPGIICSATALSSFSSGISITDI